MKNAIKITKQFIENLKKDPMRVLGSLDEDSVAALIQKANYDYYNSEAPLFSDQLYDLIKDYLEELNPKNPILKNVGAAVGTDERKEELPYFLGSLDKVKTDEKALTKWLGQYQGQYVVSDKLDGNSALIYWKGCQLKLFTRGDGVIGQNVSHLLSFIRNIPKFAGREEIAVRGELIISKSDFEKIKHKGANARNMVAGLVNAKLPDLEVAKVTQFVAYEVIHPKVSPSEQISKLKSMGFVGVHSSIHKDIDVNKLSSVLVERRDKSEFEIDGIVVFHDAVHKRVRENPSYAFAFKSVHTMQKAEVTVTHVEWNLSKDGYLIPVVNFNEVKLAGVTIKRAHGFNGKFILDNKIGPGARIIIMRSGDVIPYIMEIISPAETGNAQMPDVRYVWSKTNVDIMIPLDEKDNEELKFKNLEYFFDKIDVKGLSAGNLKKMFDSGLTSIQKIFSASIADMSRVNGFKDKTATKMVDALQERRKTLDVITVMDGSNIFGRGIGRKRIELITAEIPRILKERYVPSVTELTSIKGVERTTAEQFIVHLPRFIEFVEESDLQFVFNKENTLRDLPSNIPQTFAGQKLVFTGFRDAYLEKYVTIRGGVLVGSVSKNTTMVVKKDSENDSGKITKARELGISVINLSDFKNKYVNI